MITICRVLKDNKDYFIALDVNFMVFSINIPAKLQLYCAYIVSHWHLPLPTFLFLLYVR